MKRVAFDFSEEAINELDKLVARAGLDSRKDLFSEAVGLLDYMISNTEKNGNLPLIRTDEGLIELASRSFLTAKKRHDEGKKSLPPKKTETAARSVPIAIKTATSTGQ
jgi:hypothetical protein